MRENKCLPSSSTLTPFDGVKKDINPNEITHSLYNKIYSKHYTIDVNAYAWFLEFYILVYLYVIIHLFCLMLWKNKPKKWENKHIKTSIKKLKIFVTKYKENRETNVE